MEKSSRGISSPLADLCLIPFPAQNDNSYICCHADQKVHVYCSDSTVEIIALPKDCCRFPVGEDKTFSVQAYKSSMKRDSSFHYECSLPN